MKMYTDRPLSADEQRFVRHYVKHRDLEKAAALAKLTGKMTGKKMYARPAVREDIDRRIAVLDGVTLEMDVKELMLAADILDVELRNVCQLNAKEFGTLKMDGLRLAYILTGRLKDRNLEAIGTNSGTSTNDQPAFYQQMFHQAQTQITHTLTQAETVSVPAAPRVTQHAALPPRPEAPTIKVY
jgi:hypothetical protein